MKRVGWCKVMLCLGTLAMTLGCGDAEPPPAIDPDAQAKAKVETFKKVADAISKDPNGMEVKAALEEFRNQGLDPNANRTEAEAIVQIYRQRIKGKYQGEVAQELQAELAPLENAVKRAK